MVPGFGALGVNAKGVAPPRLIPKQRNFSWAISSDKTVIPNLLVEAKSPKPERSVLVFFGVDVDVERAKVSDVVGMNEI